MGKRVEVLADRFLNNEVRLIRQQKAMERVAVDRDTDNEDQKKLKFRSAKDRVSFAGVLFA